MSLGSRAKTWWRAAMREAQVNAQVEEELRFHVESYAEDLMRSGLLREEAMRQARVELGSVVAGRENCRQAWGTRWWDELRADLRAASPVHVEGTEGRSRGRYVGRIRQPASRRDAIDLIFISGVSTDSQRESRPRRRVRI